MRPKHDLTRLARKLSERYRGKHVHLSADVDIYSISDKVNFSYNLYVAAEHRKSFKTIEAMNTFVNNDENILFRRF